MKFQEVLYAYKTALSPDHTSTLTTNMPRPTIWVSFTLTVVSWNDVLMIYQRALPEYENAVGRCLLN
jgi:hypothetical protein